MLGVLFTLVGGALALSLVFTSPTPWQRQRLFNPVLHTPPDGIERLVILPRGTKPFRPLTQRQVTIRDPQTIRRIAQSLDAAQDIWPNHPHTKWSALVEMTTRD